MPADSEPPEDALQAQYGAFISKVQKLELLDAAYWVWRERHFLDRVDNLSPVRNAKPPLDASDSQQIGAAIRESLAAVVNEKVHASGGPTFERTKRLFPEYSHKVIREAVIRAVALEDDASCILMQIGFEYKNARAAVNEARKENFGFSDETYEALHHQLCISSR